MKFGQNLPVTPLTSNNPANVVPDDVEDFNDSASSSTSSPSADSSDVVTASLLDVLRSSDTSDKEVSGDDDISDGVEQSEGYAPASDPSSIADFDISTNDFSGNVDVSGRYRIQSNGSLTVSLGFGDKSFSMKFPTAVGNDMVDIPFVSEDGRDLTRSLPVGDLLSLLGHLSDDEISSILSRRKEEAAEATDDDRKAEE